MQRIAPPANLVVTGATGRIGGLLRAVWGEGAAQWRGRQGMLDGLPHGGTLLCLAGVVPGGGDLTLNAQIARDTVAAAEAAGMARVLLMSSSAVYPPGGPWCEDQADPANAYGLAKLAMESARSKTVEVCALRLANVAGADALLGKLTSTPPTLHIWPNGEGPRRGYVGPITLANMLAQLAAAPPPLPRVLNLAQPGTVTMDALLRAAGRDFIAKAAPAQAVAHLELDTSRLADLIPLDPRQGQAQEVVRQWQEVCR